MELIETIEVGAGGAASIEFTSIPQDADDLLLVTSLRTNSATNFNALYMYINDSTTGYYRYLLYGNGSTVANSVGSNQGFAFITWVPATQVIADTFNSSTTYFPNYTDSYYKTFITEAVLEDNITTGLQALFASSWNFTDAITKLALQPNSGNFVQYSTASLYKITKA